MFKDETCLDKFAVMLVGASIAAASGIGAAAPTGVVEALTGSTGLLARLSGQRRTEADRGGARPQGAPARAPQPMAKLGH